MLTFFVSHGSALNPLWGEGGSKETVIHTDGGNGDRGQSRDAVSQRAGSGEGDGGGTAS